MRSSRATGVLALFLAPFLLGQQDKPPPAWPVLLEAHDTDGDGKIAASEYKRGDAAFERLDTNADGWITEADLSSPELVRRTVDALIGDVVAWLADHNGDGVVTREEWQATLAKLDTDDSGTVSPEELGQTGLKGDMLGGITMMLDRDRDQRIQRQELEALFTELDDNGDRVLEGEEIIHWRASALNVGDPAPEFELPKLNDPKTLVRLSDFHGKRPVALIFGSYT